MVALDLIRFAAAVSVMLYHYTFGAFHAPDDAGRIPYPILGNIFKYGYLGVDAFFIVSGFVILMTARNRGPASFLISRATRLYPAYWACVTLMFLLAAWNGSGAPGLYLVNLTMLQSFLGFPHMESVFWTLAVELCFYGLMLAILVFGQIKRIEWLLGVWLLACVLMDFWPVARGLPWLSLLLIQEWAHYFVAGAVFCLIWEEGVTRCRLALLAVCYLQTLRHAYWHMVKVPSAASDPYSLWVLIAVLSVIFLCFLLLALHRLNVRHRFYILLGSLTYPLYLVHGTVGAMVLYNELGLAGSMPALLVASTTALGVAYLVYRLVERPFAPVVKGYLLGFFGWVSRLARRSA